MIGGTHITCYPLDLPLRLRSKSQIEYTFGHLYFRSSSPIVSTTIWKEVSERLYTARSISGSHLKWLYLIIQVMENADNCNIVEWPIIMWQLYVSYINKSWLPNLFLKMGRIKSLYIWTGSVQVLSREIFLFYSEALNICIPSIYLQACFDGLIGWFICRLRLDFADRVSICWLRFEIGEKCHALPFATPLVCRLINY